MAKLQLRIDDETKQDAEKIFNMLGVTPSQAVQMFYKQVTLQGGIPLELKVPNARLLAAMEDEGEVVPVVDGVIEWGE